MKRLRRPSLSDSRPKKSAPMTSPIRYHQAMSLTAPADMLSVFLSVRSDPTLAAMVISRPSRIHATPSAVTSLRWNLDQGNRSIRAGIRLLIYGLLSEVVEVVAMSAPFGPFDDSGSLGRGREQDERLRCSCSSGPAAVWVTFSPPLPW